MTIVNTIHYRKPTDLNVSSFLQKYMKKPNKVSPLAVRKRRAKGELLR